MHAFVLDGIGKEPGQRRDRRDELDAHADEGRAP